MASIGPTLVEFRDPQEDKFAKLSRICLWSLRNFNGHTVDLKTGNSVPKENNKILKILSFVLAFTLALPLTLTGLLLCRFSKTQKKNCEKINKLGTHILKTNSQVSESPKQTLASTPSLNPAPSSSNSSDSQKPPALTQPNQTSAPNATTNNETPITIQPQGVPEVNKPPLEEASPEHIAKLNEIQSDQDCLDLCDWTFPIPSSVLGRIFADHQHVKKVIFPWNNLEEPEYAVCFNELLQNHTCDFLVYQGSRADYGKINEGAPFIISFIKTAKEKEALKFLERLQRNISIHVLISIKEEKDPKNDLKLQYLLDKISEEVSVDIIRDLLHNYSPANPIIDHLAFRMPKPLGRLIINLSETYELPKYFIDHLMTTGGDEKSEFRKHLMNEIVTRIDTEKLSTFLEQLFQTLEFESLKVLASSVASLTGRKPISQEDPTTPRFFTDNIRFDVALFKILEILKGESENKPLDITVAVKVLDPCEIKFKRSFGEYLASQIPTESLEDCAKSMASSQSDNNAPKTLLGYGFFEHILAEGIKEKITKAFTAFWSKYDGKNDLLTLLLPQIKTKEAFESIILSIPDQLPQPIQEKIIDIFINGSDCFINLEGEVDFLKCSITLEPGLRDEVLKSVKTELFNSRTSRSNSSLSSSNRSHRRDNRTVSTIIREDLGIDINND